MFHLAKTNDVNERFINSVYWLEYITLELDSKTRKLASYDPRQYVEWVSNKGIMN